MVSAGSKSRRSRGVVLDTIDSITMLGLQLGGLVFALTVGYLLWGIFSGPLASLSRLSPEEYTRILSNVSFACTAMGISGIILLFAAAIRFYSEEITGYLLLISGGFFYWGVPIGVGMWLQSARLEAGSNEALRSIIGQFQTIGTVALVLAVPFILGDFWLKLRGVRGSTRESPRRGTALSKGEAAPRSRLYLFCWQMPYCRDYLRKYCKAYEQRKACWRIKSGCYCDENMILRVMKSQGTEKAVDFDPQFTQVAGTSRDISSSQKRERCRQCFLYTEHQRQKYRILSPLVFPVTAAVMWMYLEPVKSFLGKAIQFTDQFAGQVSYRAGAEATSGTLQNSSSTPDVVLWLFLICIGFVVVTYLLRGLEYAIFDMQI